MLRLALVALGLLLAPAWAQASNITVRGNDPRDRITLTVHDANIGQVLRNLSQKYGFTVQGLDKAEKSEALSTSMSGGLEEILRRVLRNWNHMIVRSPDKERPIERVMILNASFGAAPPQAPPATASAQATAKDAVSRAPRSRPTHHRRHRRTTSSE